MPNLVTESIWHFIGYLHLADILSAPPVHYTGGFAPSPTGLGFGPPRPAGPNGLPGLPGDGDPLDLSHNPPPPPAFVVRQMFVPPRPMPQFQPDDGEILDIGRVRPPEILTPPALRLPGVPDVHLTYEIVQPHAQVVNIWQSNTLLDLDQYGVPLGTEALGLTSSYVTHTIADMIAKAVAAVPSGAVDPGFQSDHMQAYRQGPDGEHEQSVLEQGNPDAKAEAVGNGRHVNGELVDTSVTPREASAELVDSIKVALRVAHGLDPEPEPSTVVRDRDLAEAEADSTGDHVTLASDGTPTGGFALTATTGENHLVNVAILQDRAEPLGSSIVVGDRHETNSIVQVNVFKNDDHVGHIDGTSVGALIAQQVGAQASLVNDAFMIDIQGPKIGNAASSRLPGNTQWDVTYMEGSYWDLTTVRQSNFVLDNDIASQTSGHSHFLLTQGQNGTANLTQLFNIAENYDLVIVAGDYYEFNSILQINVVLDDDVLVFNGGTGSQVLLGDGNQLLNQAAIVNIGGESWKPITDNALFIANAIGNQVTDFSMSHAAGMPGAGPGPMRVLYIDGDYYNQNILIQTNILADVDVVGQFASGGGEDGVAQTVTAGGNTASNLALLINYDSTSDYQFVGGTNYETNVLIQANIIVDDDDDDCHDEGSSGDLHPDVIAAVAALSGEDGHEEHHGRRSDCDDGHDNSGHGHSTVALDGLMH